MIRALCAHTITLLRHRHAVWLVGIVAFLDGWVLPVPPELLLVPMALAAPRRIVLLAAVCTGASVAGAVVGYGVGAGLYGELGRPMLAVLATQDQLNRLATLSADWHVWAVLITGLMPFPDRVTAVMAGGSGLSFPVFIAITLLARALRFGAAAGLAGRLGPSIWHSIRWRLGLVSR